MQDSDEEIFYFDGPDAVEAVFAGNTVGNLEKLEKKLGVNCVFRDLCLKMSSENGESRRKATAFLNELIQLYKSNAKPVHQNDFDQLLSAFRSHSQREVQSFFLERVKVGRRKSDIIPRTQRQLEYVRAIRTKDVVFGIGPAGTGKTYLAMAMAVSEYVSGKYSRIILTRPAREAGENLGFLPGNLEEKILPYLRPLYDALYDMLEFEEVKNLMEKGVIEVAPLAFMRGRTLNHAFVILDEAQNASSEQMLMFLTRLGFDSSCVVTGDPTQTDLGKGLKSGLAQAVRILKNIPEIAFCHFSSKDVVRHPLIEKIIDAYSAESKNAEKRGRIRA